jgi:hypothetical protein
VPSKPKAPQYNTPAGEFIWPWLNRPDDRPIKGKPQKPAYKLEIRYPANAPAWLKHKEKLDELVDESYEKAVAENPKKKKSSSASTPTRWRLTTMVRRPVTSSSS